MRVFDIEQEHNLDLEARWHTLRDGEGFEFRGVHRDAHGIRQPITATVNAFDLEDQRLLCLMAQPALADPRSAKQLDTARGVERDVFRGIFEHANEAIAIIDHEGRYLLQNEAHRELLGFESPDLHDKTPAIHLGPTVFQEVARVLARDGKYRAQHTSRRKDGEERRIELSAFAVEQANAQTPIFVGIKRDVHESNRVERERTDRELSALEEGLRQAHKMKAIGHLAAGIAHDLNNLLTPILGFSDAERLNLDLPKETRASLTTIVEAAQRGRELTRRLLAFGREQTLTLAPIDLQDRARGMLDMLRRILPTRISCELSASESLPPTMANATAIEQVLMNLAANAADAMPDGGVLRIALKRRVVAPGEQLTRTLGSDGDFVEISVSDTGVGMAAEDLEHIYEPFFTTKPPGQGTGLGLSIVHGIVRQHHGLITVDSKKGHGTTFRIILPSTSVKREHPATSTVQTSATSARHKSAAKPIPLRNRKTTIILADDEAPVRSFVQGQLEDMGCHVLPAASGAAALEVARNHDGPIDLLLTDVVMPGVNGPQLHRELCRTMPELPAVFMSGHIATLQAEDANTLGRSILRKPFTRGELRACLQAKLVKLRDPHSGEQEASS